MPVVHSEEEVLHDYKALQSVPLDNFVGAEDWGQQTPFLNMSEVLRHEFFERKELPFVYTLDHNQIVMRPHEQAP